jgi:hypothetical protein
MNISINGGINATKRWIKENKGEHQINEPCPLPVLLRNRIHQSRNKSMNKVRYTQDELKQYIKLLINVVKNAKDFKDD